VTEPRAHGGLRATFSRLTAIILTAALVVAASGCSAPNQIPTAIDSYDMTAVRHFLAGAAPVANGMALVVLKDGVVVENSGYDRFGPGTVVDIGSSSRWLAAAAMMTLVDQGTLSLDDPVSKYLPEFTGDKAAITVRQLWSGTSGLPDTDPSLTIRSITLEECVRRIAAQPLSFTPGASVSGGAAGIQAGARVCEVISGMTWQNFFRVRIAEPLDMASTSFAMMGFGRNPFVAGAARSTAQDYARFLLMLLQKGMWSGRRILSEQAVAAIDQDQVPSSPILSSPYTSLPALLPGAGQARPCLGAWREETESGSTIVACPGGGGFMPWIDEHLNLAGVLSMQYDLTAAAYSIVQIRQLVPRAIAAGQRFKDVPATSWAFTAIADLSSRGLVSGFEENRFLPDRALSRAEFAALVCNALGAQSASITTGPFTDVAKEYWAAGFIATAVQKGWLTGYSSSLFKPEEPIQIAQVLAAIARSQGWKTTSDLPYADTPRTLWARASIESCFAMGIIRNPDPGITAGRKLNPAVPCTRAQACVMISRLLTITKR
jgi:CubicO group peptidase (beta-lactamase class C family)